MIGGLGSGPDTGGGRPCNPGLGPRFRQRPATLSVDRSECVALGIPVGGFYVYPRCPWTRPWTHLGQLIRSARLPNLNQH